MLEIITIPNPLLRKKSKPVAKITPAVLKLAKEMTELIKKGPEGKRIGVGLSAVQIGQPIRLFVAYDKNNDKELTFINPKISWKSKRLTDGVPGSKNQYEGCLSVPDFIGLVKRHWSIKLSYLTTNDQRLTTRFSGFIATVIQHEMDHLDGILFPQRLAEQGGKLLEIEKE